LAKQLQRGQVPFVFSSGSDFVEMFSRVGASRVETIVTARTILPYFYDERVGGRGNNKLPRLMMKENTYQLLTRMDVLYQAQDVMYGCPLPSIGKH